MKVVISSMAYGLDSLVVANFGSCSRFVIADPDSGKYETLPNPVMEKNGDVGAQAAEFVSYLEADEVIGCSFDRSAYEALKAKGIKVFSACGQTVKEAMENYRQGNLSQTIYPAISRQ